MTHLDSLIEEARNLLKTEPSRLGQLTEELRDILNEKSYRVGTVRKWGGVEYQKLSDRTWAKVAKGQFKRPAPPGGIASVPVHQFKKPTPPKAAAAASAPAARKPTSHKPPEAKTAPVAAPKEPSTPSVKAGARATADSLPDDPYKYFKKTPDSQLVPVSALRTIRARPEGIKNAAVHMANAFNGEGEKRKPISLKDNGDGTYTVADGNSTTAMAKQHKWKNIVAVVEPPSASKDDHPGEKHTEPHPPAHAPEPKFADHASIGASVPGFADAVKAGKLAPGTSVEQHVKIADAFLTKHAENLEQSMGRLQEIMPSGAKVKGRVKELKSALGKLVRKPKYQTADRLQDGTGMRVIAQDTATLKTAVDQIRKKYKIVSEDDYISAPLEGEKGLGYRSHHFIIEDKDGLQKEIQVRTPNQNTHADWCHDVYKPVSPAQEAAMKEHSDQIAQYARDMGHFFEKVDKAEKPGSPPDCPPPVKQYFSCL